MANVPTMFFGLCRESKETVTDDPPQKSQRHLRALRGTTLLRPKNVSWSPHPPTICLNILLWSRQTRACFGDPVYTFIDIEQRTRRSVAFRRLSSTSCALMESACAPRERISAYPGCVICLEPWARTTRTFDLANWTSRTAELLAATIPHEATDARIRSREIRSAHLLQPSTEPACRNAQLAFAVHCRTV